MNIRLLIGGIFVVAAAIFIPIFVTFPLHPYLISYIDAAAYFIGAILIFASLFGNR